MTNFNLALHRLRRRVHPWSLVFLKPMWTRHQIKKFHSVYFPAFKSTRDRKKNSQIAREIVYLYYRFKCIPFHYFHYSLYRTEFDKEDIKNFLPETVFYYRILPKINDNYYLLDDKIVTDEILSNYDCPRPKLLMICRKGAWYDGRRRPIDSIGAFIAALEDVKEHGFVVKPAVLSSGGHGILFFRWDEVQGWRDQTGLPLSEQLFRHAGADFIVQRRCINGGSLGHLGDSVLQCVRILTSTLSGRPECLYAILKISESGTGVDNGHAGGAYLSVDIETGLVSDLAYNEKGHVSCSSSNPSRRFAISEIDDLVTIAKRASLAFPTLPIIGWDIGITTSGPKIIEGNSSPGLALIQKPHRGSPKLIQELNLHGYKV